MKHAIIVTGGKQYRVAEGDVVFIEKLSVEAGDTVTFDQVLAVVDENASNFGTPTIAGATVTASVVKNGKAKKVRVVKKAAARPAVARVKRLAVPRPVRKPPPPPPPPMPSAPPSDFCNNTTPTRAAAIMR